MARTYTEVG